MPRLLVTAVSAVATFFVVITGWWVRREPTGGAPSVLVVVWENVRADRLTNEPERTPTPWLDDAVDSAVVFERAYTPAVFSLSAHAALLTGLPPASSGVDPGHMWLDQRFTTFADPFTTAGYDTAAFVGSLGLGDDTNLLRDFDTRWVSHDLENRDPVRAHVASKLVPGDRSQELGLRAPGPRPDPTWRGRFKDAAPLVADRVLDWLDERDHPEQPFLAYVSLAEARLPRLPSASAREAVIADAGLIARSLATDQTLDRQRAADGGEAPYTRDQLDVLGAVYDATLHDLDRATQTIVEGLAERGLLDSTVVVLTSDHGAPLGDHGRLANPTEAWESVVRVPLVVWAPTLEAARRAAPASTIDLFGTLCELAGVVCPEGLGSVFSAPSPAVIATPAGPAIVDGPHKLVDDQVFDVVADPGETQPLDDLGVRDALALALASWRKAQVPYDPAARADEDQPDLVREGQAELRRALGLD